MKKALLLSALILLCACKTDVPATPSSGAINGFDDYFEVYKEAINDETVIAAVNGEPIYKRSIVIQHAYEELSKQQLIKALEETDDSVFGYEEKQKSIKEAREKKLKTDKEILDELIRKEVVYQEAVKNGCSASYEEAYDQAKEAYELVKELALKEGAAESDIESYQFILDTMEVLGFDEERYLEKAAEDQRQFMTRNNLYTLFRGDSENGDYEKYVDSLVKKAKIEKKSNGF